MLSEVSLIKDRQEDLDGKLDTMKNENEALWREVGALKLLLSNFHFHFLLPSFCNPGVEPASEAHPAAEDCEQVDSVPGCTCPTKDGRWIIIIIIVLAILKA